MVCGGCGATIADKAIVCYRCGTPTAVPASPVRDGGVKTRRSPLAPLVLVLVALALGWFSASAEPQSGTQIAAGAGAVLALVSGAVLWLRPRR